MRPLSPRELVLHNLLAQAATLVFRAAKAMEKPNLVLQQTLVIECEEWIFEAVSTLSAEIATEERSEVLPTSARPAGNPGREPSYQTVDLGWHHPPPAQTTGISPEPQTPSEPEVPSSGPSSGGMKEPLKPSTKPSTLSPLDFFGMRL